jgi:hypothetical protein
MTDQDRLRDELDRWFIEIGVTESGGEKAQAARDAGFRLLDTGHTYDDALAAAKRHWEVERGGPESPKTP